ncbi:MAG: recombination mediator RecR [Chloroflexota bacterium]|nr:recombination mediator RecR [Anaerolineae bacterium]HMM28528.1 recombination mediator RecR [Aggregatilineaceae bacterium]
MSKAIPQSVTQLIEAFSRLPGVGPKTASRLTYYLLRAPDELSQTLAAALTDLKAKTRYCSVCFNITEQDPCPICRDEARDASQVVVVEDPLDVLAVERTGAYDGRYHVLHGAISPVEGIGPEDLKIRELVARVQGGTVREVIIATNPGMEGDATAMYVQRQLAPTGVRVTRLARGLPTGGDLEYVDSVTLLRALQGRHEM